MEESGKEDNGELSSKVRRTILQLTRPRRTTKMARSKGSSHRCWKERKNYTERTKPRQNKEKTSKRESRTIHEQLADEKEILVKLDEHENSGRTKKVKKDFNENKKFLSSIFFLFVFFQEIILLAISI